MREQTEGTVWTREAETAAESGLLGREAAWRRALAGPGILPVVRHGATAAGGIELAVARPDGEALSTARLSPGRWAEAAVSLLDTVSRVHAAGAALGPQAVDSVVVPAVGRPVVVDLASCRAATPADRAGDVQAVAAALLACLDRSGGDERRRRHLELARTSPPEAARLARRLHHPPRRPAVPAAVLLAVAAASGAILVLRPAAPAAPGAPSREAPPAPPTSPQKTGPVTVAVTSGPDVGGTLHHEGRRFGVDPGDLAVTGDFDCDGVATVAALRPATGEVAVFETWPGAGGAVAGRVVARVPGAVSVRAARVGDCDVLLAEGADGTVQVPA